VFYQDSALLAPDGDFPEAISAWMTTRFPPIYLDRGRLMLQKSSR